MSLHDDEAALRGHEGEFRKLPYPIAISDCTLFSIAPSLRWEPVGIGGWLFGVIHRERGIIAATTSYEASVAAARLLEMPSSLHCGCEDPPP